MVRPSIDGRSEPLAAAASVIGDVSGEDVDWETSPLDPALALDDLTDVEVPSPADGDALIWDDYLQLWVPGASGGLALSDATPVADGGAGSPGVGTDASRDDHQHPGDAIRLGFVLDGGGSAISTGGPKYMIEVPADCTITEWSCESIDGTSSSTTFDPKRRAYGGGAAASLVGAGTKPFISAGTENRAAPSGWTSVALLAGDKLYVHVDANDNMKLGSMTLLATRD